MRLLRRLLTIVVVLILLLTAGAYLLPREVTVTRAATIAAPADKIFPLLNSLKAASAWSPWVAKDPAMAITYDGPAEGVGARMVWKSAVVGDGTQEIAASTPGKDVTSTLTFGNMSSSTASFTLTPTGTGTVVVWTLHSDMGMNPMGRWIGLMMDRFVGPDFEQGLSSLKSLAEAG
jgi:Polyketide cyclase / dehydrase and lipid transport